MPKAVRISVAMLLGCGSCSTSLEPSRTTVASPDAPVAAEYPTHAIRLIVPFAKGGGADTWGRFVADKLGVVLGQPFVVENVPGEGGNRGTEVVSRASPDGYTLLLGSVGPLVVHPCTYNRLPFDAENDFVPVGLLESSPLLLLVHPEVPAHSVTELVSASRADPGGLSFATNGNGSPEQVVGEIFERLVHVALRDVPYDGAGPARADLSRGRVTMMFDPIKAAMSAVRDGKQRPLAVADERRAPALPDVPTFRELGYPELSMRIWTGLFAPRGTSTAAVTKLNAALRTVLEDPSVRDAIKEVGGTPAAMTSEETNAFIDAERAKWKGLVSDTGIPRVDGPI
ncbi:MAG TPA: tripartite tricarboxylate transporter substrate binding protein [Polyangiaceae bacterium]|jgi:tripartite-type tricarboxylate transporter receptor subunit TctC|nr:tripartite tricarboxylate transporter substrate binding protein [Polyangiaceae bacterium]